MIFTKSCKPSQVSANQKFQYLDLRNGRSQGGWTVTDGQSLGVSMMLNTGESPSEERESTVLQILERERELEKYFLSPKACQGILNRATKRGKTLPPILEEALRQQSRERERESYNIQANCIDRAITAGCNGRGWSTGAMYTLTTMDVHAVAYYMFDNHSQDTRYTGPVNISQTLSATLGAGGNNTPFIVEELSND